MYSFKDEDIDAAQEMLKTDPALVASFDAAIKATRKYDPALMEKKKNINFRVLCGSPYEGVRQSLMKAHIVASALLAQRSGLSLAQGLEVGCEYFIKGPQP